MKGVSLLYIQKQPEWGGDREPAPLQIPENYSGTTVTPAAPPTGAESAAGAEPPLPEKAAEPEAAAGAILPGEAAGRMEKEEQKPRGGGAPWQAMLSRFPFLSSLLPPKRGAAGGTQTSELALIVGVLLLLSGEQDDILPLLLILLLA